jgi:hypothetical protein
VSLKDALVGGHSGRFRSGTKSTAIVWLKTGSLLNGISR